MFNSGFVREGCSVGTDWSQPSITLKCTSSEEFGHSGEMKKITISCDDAAKDLDSEPPTDVETTGISEEAVFTSNTNVDDAVEKSSASFEHTDFMDKAVAVAIQKKGLSTLSGIEYG
jgi:hypothetical protein